MELLKRVLYWEAGLLAAGGLFGVDVNAAGPPQSDDAITIRRGQSPSTGRYTPDPNR